MLLSGSFKRSKSKLLRLHIMVPIIHLQFEAGGPASAGMEQAADMRTPCIRTDVNPPPQMQQFSRNLMPMLPGYKGFPMRSIKAY